MSRLICNEIFFKAERKHVTCIFDLFPEYFISCANKCEHGVSFFYVNNAKKCSKKVGQDFTLVKIKDILLIRTVSLVKLYNECGWINLSARRHQQKLYLMHKIYNGKFPTYILT